MFSNYPLGTLPFIASLLLCFTACTSEESTSNDSSTTSASTSRNVLRLKADSGIDFNNQLTETVDHHIGIYDYFYNGGGVAIGDLDNDGLDDVVMSGNLVADRLYKNMGGLTFEERKNEIANKTDTWSNGVQLVDINGDGMLDIYVCKGGFPAVYESARNQLFINEGDWRFSEQAAKYGIDDPALSTNASFFDMDNDGDLDLFVLNHSSDLSPTEGNYKKRYEALEAKFNGDAAFRRKNSCRLYERKGDQYIDVTKAGLGEDLAYGLGVSTLDYNDDGLVDIYVSNDFFVPDRLYINQGNGSFKDEIKERSGHTSFFSMGCDGADFNNDGTLDLMVVDMTPKDRIRNKTLMASMNPRSFGYYHGTKGFHHQYMFNAVQLNRGDGYFSETAHQLGLSKTDWSWSVLFADFDGDMWKDVFVSNGYFRDVRDNDFMRRVRNEKIARGGQYNAQQKLEAVLSCPQHKLSNHFYRNEAGQSFSYVSKAWKADQKSFSNGAAIADLDNDGDPDLIVNNINDPAFVYENRSAANKHVQLSFDSPFDPAHYNVKIHAYLNAQQLYEEWHPSRGYQSNMHSGITLGLGNAKKIDSLLVYWKDGSRLKLTDISSDKAIRLSKQDADKTNANALTKTEGQYFRQIDPISLGIDYTHQENPFNDFQTEVLLPHKQSTKGPAFASTDLNRDGQSDFIFGGSAGQAAQLYISNKQAGKLIYQAFDSPILSSMNAFEDVDACFIDIDRDGDIDLFCAGGGGSQFKDQPALYSDRLFINQEDQLLFADAAFSNIEATNAACIRPHDFDQDGDPDFFIGGGALAGQYPRASRSYLLKNVGFSFEDATTSLCPTLLEGGMINDAKWVDLDGDQTMELLTVGEFNAFRIFKLVDGVYQDQTNSFLSSPLTGIWFSIYSSDLDGDGDQDILLGNIGTNNKFKDSELHVFSNDFDNNGTVDCVLAKEESGTLYPVRGFECSSEQMPFLKKKFDTYSDFAHADLDKILKRDKLDKAYSAKVNTYASIILENIDGQSFKRHELPFESQLSPLSSALIYDFNKDSIKDILHAGNYYDTEVETPRYDAGYGQLLLGKGDFKYQAVSPAKSGFYANGNVRHIAPLKINDLNHVMVVRNNDFPLLYQLK